MINPNRTIDRPISSLTHEQNHFDKLHNYLFYLLNTSPKKLHGQTFILNKLNTLNFLYCNPHNLMKHLKERHYKVKTNDTNKIINVDLTDLNYYLKEYSQQLVMWQREKTRWSFNHQLNNEYTKKGVNISECKPKLYAYFDQNSPTNLHTGLNSLGLPPEEESEEMNKTEFLNTFGKPEKLKKNKYGFYTDIESFRDITYSKTYRKGIHAAPIEQFQQYRKISRGDYGLHVIKLCIIDKIPLPFWLKHDPTMYSRIFGLGSEVKKEEVSFMEMYEFLKETYKPKDTKFKLTEKARIETEKNKISDLVFVYGMVFCSTQKKLYQIFLMALMENREDIIKFLFKKSVPEKSLFKVNNDINRFNKQNEYSYSNYIDLNSNIFWLNEKYLKETSLKYQFNFKEEENLRKGIFPSKGMFSNDSAVFSLIYTYMITNGPTFYNLCIATNKIEIFKEFEKYQECDFFSGYANINNIMLLQLTDNKHILENKHITINNESINLENINFYLTNEQYTLISSYSEELENIQRNNTEIDITNKLEKRFLILENYLNCFKKESKENKHRDRNCNTNNEIRLIANENIVPTYLEIKDWIFKTSSYYKTGEEIQSSLNSNRFYEKVYLIYTYFNDFKKSFKKIEKILGYKCKIEDKKFLKDVSILIANNSSNNLNTNNINTSTANCSINKSKTNTTGNGKGKTTGNGKTNTTGNGKNTITENKIEEEDYRLIKYKLKASIEELIVFKDTLRKPKDIFINLFKFENFSKSYFYKNSVEENYKKAVSFFQSFDKNYRFQYKNKISTFSNLKTNGRIYLTDFHLLKYSNIKKLENIFPMLKFQYLFNKVSNTNEDKDCFLYQSDYQKTLILFYQLNLLDGDVYSYKYLTPLHMAAFTGNLDTLIFLLSYYDVNSKDMFGYFPCDYTFLEVFNRRCYTVLKLCGGRSKFEEDRFKSKDNIKLYNKIQENSFEFVDLTNIKSLYKIFKPLKGNYENFMEFYFEKRLFKNNREFFKEYCTEIEDNEHEELKGEINLYTKDLSITKNNSMFYTFCNLNLIKFIKIKDIFNKSLIPNYWLKLDIPSLKIINEKNFCYKKKLKPNFKTIYEKIQSQNFSIINLKYRFVDKSDVLNKSPVNKINRNIFFLLLNLDFIDHRKWFSTKISILSQIIAHSIIDRPYDIPYDLINENLPEFSIGFLKEESINSIDFFNFKKNIFQLNISINPLFNIAIDNNKININQIFLDKTCPLNEHTYNLYLYDFFRDKTEFSKGPAHQFAIHLSKDVDLKNKYSVFLPWVGIIPTGLESKHTDSEIINGLIEDMSNIYAFYNINSFYKKSKEHVFEKIFIKCEDFLVAFDLFVDGTNLFNDLIFN